MVQKRNYLNRNRLHVMYLLFLKNKGPSWQFLSYMYVFVVYFQPVCRCCALQTLVGIYNMHALVCVENINFSNFKTSAEKCITKVGGNFWLLIKRIWATKGISNYVLAKLKWYRNFNLIFYIILYEIKRGKCGEWLPMFEWEQIEVFYTILNIFHRR